MEEKQKEKRVVILDYVIAIILGIATILGALSAYYSDLWGGNMQKSYNDAITNLNESNTMYLEALSEYNKIDLSVPLFC